MNLTCRFVAHRQQRRTDFDTAPALIDYERQREWLEGLASTSNWQAGDRAKRCDCVLAEHQVFGLQLVAAAWRVIHAEVRQSFVLAVGGDQFQFVPT